jgi:acyl-CoA synthetase (AMP-forming)/AMP-acid ligase II
MLPGDFPRLHPGTRTAIEAEDHAWTYGEIDALADRFAAFFTAELQPGDRASLFCVNEPALVAAYFGAFRARVVANPSTIACSRKKPPISSITPAAAASWCRKSCCR